MAVGGWLLPHCKTAIRTAASVFWSPDRDRHLQVAGKHGKTSDTLRQRRGEEAKPSVATQTWGTSTDIGNKRTGDSEPSEEALIHGSGIVVVTLRVNVSLLQS